MSKTRILILLIALGALSACSSMNRKVAPAWSADGDPRSRFGNRTMGVGDVNGDGYGDLMVGAPAYDTNRGKAYLYCGGPAGLSAGAKPCWTAEGSQVGGQFGDRVGQAGDVNGDGYDDVFLSVPFWKGVGRCEVYLGGPKGLGKAPNWALSPKDGGLSQAFGDCTHPTGDVNGDGYDDLLVGAYQANSATGRALLYLGGPKGLSQEPVWEGRGEAEGDQYGYTLAGVGDLNGDGFGDVIVGAKFHDPSRELGLKDKSRVAAGKAYLYYGTAHGLSPVAAKVFYGEQIQSQLSVRSFGLGDLNGDSHPEFGLSEPGLDTGKGALRVYSAPGLAVTKEYRGRDFKLTDFGRASSPAGDMNGDGYDDLAVVGRVGERGQVLLFFGGPHGLSSRPQFFVQAPDESGAYGCWVAPAGDLDGDGLADLVIGAELYNGSGSLNGRVYVCYGKQVSTNESIAPKMKQHLKVYLPRRAPLRQK